MLTRFNASPSSQGPWPHRRPMRRRIRLPLQRRAAYRPGRRERTESDHSVKENRRPRFKMPSNHMIPTPKLGKHEHKN